MSESKNIKQILKKNMDESNITSKALSKKSGICFFRIIYLLYIPFSKIKFTEGIRISKALGINVCELFRHPI